MKSATGLNGSSAAAIVALADFCKELGLDKGGAKKAIQALQIRTGKEFMRKGRVRDNQPGWVLTREHANEVLALRREAGFVVGPRAERGAGLIAASAGQPTVYLIRLHGDRIKLGYSDMFEQRLAAHRTLAPDLDVVRRWMLPQAYELVFLDIVRATGGVTELGSEVFAFQPEVLTDLISTLDDIVRRAGRMA